MSDRFHLRYRNGAYYVSEPNIDECEVVKASRHDARVKELLEANNREVERRRTAEAQLTAANEKLASARDCLTFIDAMVPPIDALSACHPDALRGILTKINDKVAFALATHPTTPASLCEDCPPVGYPTDKTRCDPCPRRTPASHEGQRDDFTNSVHCLIFSMIERGVTGDDPWWGQDFLSVKKALEGMGRGCDPAGLKEAGDD